METSFDFLSDILDEIALEGLDGITLSALWIRLENRPHFCLPLDEESKIFIWECIAVHKQIEIYELPEARPPLILCDRYDHLDPEFGLVTEPSCKPLDIYPMEIIDDGPNRGSCKFYTVRKVITSQMRYGSVLLMSLKQALDGWADKLVLVASSRLRLLALVGAETDPSLKMTKEQYSLLERIGRARFQGDVSQGESGLLTFRTTSIGDNLHYYLLKLKKHGLVTKQKHILRTKSGKTVSGSLFHLARFYVLRKIKCDALLEFMYSKIKDKPFHQEESKTLQQEMGISPHTFRKLLKRFAHKWFRLGLVPHSKVYPNDNPENGLLKNGEQKMVKVIQMIRPYVYEEELIDSEEDDGEESNVNPYFDSKKVLLDKPLSCQAYKTIVDAGPNGMTLAELRNALTLPRLDIRGLCRLLVKKNKLITVMHENGRQRYERFIAKQFQSQSMSYINIKEQADQFNQQQQDDEMHGILTSTNSKDTGNSQLIEVANAAVSETNKATDFENVKSQIIEKSCMLPLQRTPSLAATMRPMSGLPDRQVSARLLKRANIVISFLKHSRVSTVTELLKLVRAEERREGYHYDIDKRSIMRLVSRLCTDNRVKVLKAILKQGEMTKELEFVCHPSLDTSDIEFKTAIEQAKFQHFNRTTSKHPNNQTTDTPSVENTAFVLPSTEGKENINRKILTPIFARQLYGLQPKFSKTKALHLFLCYLVHYYDGQETEEKAEPFVYHSSDSWKRFIPPLPKYKRDDWCILSDAISRLPLSIFVKIINLKYEMPDLEEILRDPIKQQCLVKHLPQDLKNVLLADRRYLFSISEILNRLCHMGLVSFGPRIHFQKDQVYIYVYRNTQIKDTSLCSPGYLQIDKTAEYFIRKYHFQKLSDVENYWIDLETTCLNTLLGRYGSAIGQNVCILDPNQKPDLLDSTRNKEFEEINDAGIPPGDGLGAAGLDSSLFAHLRRNWAWPSSNYKIPVSKQKQKRLAEKQRSTLQYLLETGAKKLTHPQSRIRLQRFTTKFFGLSKKRTSEEPIDTTPPPLKKPKIAKAKKMRTLKNKAPNKQKRPFYDDKDRVAMGTMRKMRVDWAPQEDSLLLMCKVTSMFLDMKSKCLVVPYTVVRDVLNAKLPQFSFNKTSRACQRRLRHMLISSKECRNSVGVFLGEAKQDNALMKEYDVIKPPKTKEDRWKEMFTTLLDKLLLKFTSSGEYDERNVIPNTITEVYSQYDIVHLANVMDLYCQYQEPKNDIDIYHAVICTVVLSSLSSMGDGKNWSYILYKIYEQYPENMLRAVLDQLHKKRLITRKMSYKRPKSSKEEEHVSSIPYRFSVTYDNCFLTKYPIRLYNEVSEVLEKFTKGDVHLQGETPAGYITAMISFILLNKMTLFTKVPEQIIVFNVSLTETQRSTIAEEMKTNSADEKSAQSIDKKETTETPKAKRLKLDSECIEKDHNAKTIPSTSVISMSMKESEDTNIELQNISFSSRLAFYMLHQQLEQKVEYQDDISINPCQLTCKLTSNTQDISPHISSMIPMQVSSQALTPQVVDTSVNKLLLKSIMSSYSSYIPFEFLHDRNYSDMLETAYKDYTSNKNMIQIGKQLLQAISSFENLGISHSELWQKFPVLSSVSLLAHLCILMDAKLIIRVGTASFRYVGIMHGRMWLLISMSTPDFETSEMVETETSEIVEIETIGTESSETAQMETSETIKTQTFETAGTEISQTVGKETFVTELDRKNKVSNKICSDDTLNESTTKETKVLKQPNLDLKAVGPGTCLRDSTNLDIPQRVSVIMSNSRNAKTKPEISSEHGSVLFLPKLWRKPDGSLNGPTLVKFLKVILSQIMCFPGITEEKVCERFSLPFHSACTMELIDILERTHCIYRYYMKNTNVASLFSKCAHRKLSLIGQPGDTVHYEAHIDAAIKLSKLCDYILSLDIC